MGPTHTLTHTHTCAQVSVLVRRPAVSIEFGRCGLETVMAPSLRSEPKEKARANDQRGSLLTATKPGWGEMMEGGDEQV